MAVRTMEVLVVVWCLLVGSVIGSADGKEIEARRRSALDKNFMRFGRNYPNAHMLYHLAAHSTGAADDRDFTKRNSNKETRTPAKSGNLMRFGRAGNNFLRFGRNDMLNSLDDQEASAMLLMDRPNVRASNSFLRFGRTKPSKVFVPAGDIWPLMNQQQQPETQQQHLLSENEEYEEETPDTAMDM